MIDKIKQNLDEFNEASGVVSCYFSIAHDKKEEFIAAVKSTTKSPFGFWILFDNCTSCGKGNYHAELIQDSEEDDYKDSEIEFIYKQSSQDEVPI